MVGYEDGWLESENKLSQGFQTYFPIGPNQGWHPGKMRVYGTSDMYLPASVVWG